MMEGEALFLVVMAFFTFVVIPFGLWLHIEYPFKRAANADYSNVERKP